MLFFCRDPPFPKKVPPPPFAGLQPLVTMAIRTLIHCPLSTCPSAPWPDLVPSLLVGPPDHAQRVGAIPVDAVSTWLDHFPRCPEEPIDWCAHHRLDLWASDYVGSGSRFIGLVSLAISSFITHLRSLGSISLLQWCRRGTSEATTPQLARDRGRRITQIPSLSVALLSVPWVRMMPAP